MSIEEARRAVQAAARGDWKMVEAVEAMARAVFRDELIKLSLASVDEIARLSPAPVGGETRIIRQPAGVDGNYGFAHDPHDQSRDDARDAATPPPAEPDGREGKSAVAMRLAALPHEEIARLKQAVEAGGKRIADLEQRLAEARRVAAQNAARAKESDEIADNTRATLAERDRRIAAALDELQAVAAGQSEISNVFALLSPATDKGGE